jgi:hypothetical protein
VEKWEQQTGESRLWYRRFRAWLQQPRRSLLAVYREDWERRQARKGAKGREFKATSAPSSWRRAYVEWQWEERAQAYDAHLDAIAPDYVARALYELRLEAPRVARELAQAGVAGQLDHNQIRAAMAVLDRAGLSPAQRHEISGPGGGPIQLTDEQRARALATLTTALGAHLADADPGATGTVGTGEHAPVDGDLEPGG